MGEISPGLYRAGSGEPLVLLHGFTGTWHHWRPLLGDLVAGYEVIAPTLAGHQGGPQLDVDAPLTFDLSADHLERHLDEIGVGTAHFVGNSMGGGLAIELAKRGRARSVVALAPAGGWSQGDGESKRLARFFARQLRVTRLSKTGLPYLMRRPTSRRLALREIMRRGDLVAPADAVDLAFSSLGCTIAGKAIQALRADSGLAIGDLDRVSCPVLLASPQFDRILPAERHAPRFRREIPGVESRTLPGCGHVPMWDDTRLVVRTITEFVGRHVEQSAEQPDGLQPDGPQPDASQPDASQPDASQPDASQPDASQPDASRSAASRSDPSRPDASSASTNNLVDA
jgi:pimeloyl-ACP methyl ester carboxylesterase